MKLTEIVQRIVVLYVLYPFSANTFIEKIDIGRHPRFDNDVFADNAKAVNMLISAYHRLSHNELCTSFHLLVSSVQLKGGLGA